MTESLGERAGEFAQLEETIVHGSTKISKIGRRSRNINAEMPRTRSGDARWNEFNHGLRAGPAFIGLRRGEVAHTDLPSQGRHEFDAPQEMIAARHVVTDRSQTERWGQKNGDLH
jgi:hypothetical protein